MRWEVNDFYFFKFSAEEDKLLVNLVVSVMLPNPILLSLLEKFTLLMRILAIEKVEARLIPELYCYIAFFLAVFPVFALYYTSI